MPTAADERKANRILGAQRRNSYLQCVQYENQQTDRKQEYQDLIKDIEDYEEDVTELEAQISNYEWESFLRPHLRATLPAGYRYIESAIADLYWKKSLIKDKKYQYQYAVKLHKHACKQLQRAIANNEKLTREIRKGLNKYWVRTLIGILPQTLPLIEVHILSFLQ